MAKLSNVRAELNYCGGLIMLIPLQRGILYGPVNSRRLGKSLGINLMPSEYKLCSFNCVYCHYGWTRKPTMDTSKYIQDLPTFDHVVKAVDEAARSSLQFDFLTFSGNGEPTLHPRFPELVDEVVAIRNQHRPRVKVALLSNSSGLVNPGVRESIAKIDIPIFKLDAGSEKKFRLINRPAGGVNFTEILNLLCSLNDIYIQTIFIQGSPANVSKEDLKAYFGQLQRIQPVEAQIYSIDRPVPKAQIALVSPERLKEIASQGQRETGVKINPFFLDR
ncbi:MAG: radical SAM protein [Syntrophobacterales bacterium]